MMNQEIKGGQVETEEASGFVWYGSAAALAWGFLLQVLLYEKNKTLFT